SQRVDALGQTVRRTIDPTGTIVERTYDSADSPIHQEIAGRIVDLPVVTETTNAAGQTVRVVRDSSGAQIELTLDAAGSLLSWRVVSPAPDGLVTTVGGTAGLSATIPTRRSYDLSQRVDALGQTVRRTIDPT